MTTIVGRWAVTLRTPVGRIEVELRFDDTPTGLEGIAIGKSETVPLRDIRVEDLSGGDQRITWRQSITRPMRLLLDFDVTLAGDALDGFSRAGRLPRSPVTGRRSTAHDGPAEG